LARKPTGTPFQQHPMWRGATIFSAGTGVVILLLWMWRAASGSLGLALQTEPFGTVAFLVAEMATAIALLVAAYGLMTGASWVRRFYLVATGMLLFAGVMGLGRYADAGQAGIVFLYLFLGAVALFFALRVEED